MNRSKKIYCDIFWVDEVIIKDCPFSIWMAWGKYFRELIQKEEIKTIPTKDEYKQLFTDFVKNIG
jgi:hypothetical protein